ncbi:hypothetical protein MPER_08679 [Moniliophthora perniciosa FA553]|nr:hypothetical protein MPER_08679 [Moniliophthora perniciosa FA553]
MLGDTQLAAFHDWLAQVGQSYNSWAAYPTEKETLLEAMHSVPNVFMLSGDRHETLEKESNATVTKEFQVTETDEEGKQVIVVQQQEVPRERVVKYAAERNHKWSTFEVDTRDQDKPTLRLELMINGKPSFHSNLLRRQLALLYLVV